MKTTLVLFSLLALVLSAKFSQEFTHYVFEREYPATVCLEKDCPRDDLLNYKSGFNMHGLWPNGKAPRDYCYRPQNCNSQKFKPSLMNDNLNEYLDQHFVGLFSSTRSFRQHEFEKHGTCTMEANYMTQEELQNFYFGKIRDLNEKYNLEKALENYGITPSDSKTYSFEQIYTALSTSFGKDYEVAVKCISLDGQQYLHTVQMFLTTKYEPTYDLCKGNKKNLRNLAQVQTCNPSKRIQYPVFNSNSNNFSE